MKRISFIFSFFDFFLTRQFFGLLVIYPSCLKDRETPSACDVVFAMVRQVQTFAFHHRDPRISFPQYKLQSHYKGLTLTLCDLTSFALLDQISYYFFGGSIFHRSLSLRNISIRQFSREEAISFLCCLGWLGIANRFII